MFQSPIINQPQVAILSTDGITRKPTVIEDNNGIESIVIRPIGILSLAWDHRAFDGAYAASFLKFIKDFLEKTNWEKRFTLRVSIGKSRLMLQLMILDKLR